jgi:carboxyl-terminal processing protease
VILGTKSTFGKGTVQTFLPIQGSSSTDFPKGFGQVKVTIQKFYRIDGSTTQLQGVIPDVIVPDVYDGVKQGESEMNFHLPYDKIKAASYSKYDGSSVTRKAMAVAAAKKRIAVDAHYTKVSARAKELKKFRESYTWSLNLESYTKQQQAFKEEEKKYQDSSYKPSFADIVPLSADIQDAGDDESKKAQRTDWLKSFKKDADLDQAVMILSDLAVTSK